MVEVLIFGLSTNQGGIETYLKKIWDNIDRNKFHFSFCSSSSTEQVKRHFGKPLQPMKSP